MTDDTRKTGKPDRIRINYSQVFERRDWCRKFGISATRLKEAVEAVGPMVADIKKYLIERIENA